MEKLCVCKECGRVIDREFIYCPWCGDARMDIRERNSMDAIFDRIVESQNQYRDKRVESLLGRLDELDRELSTLALSVEMHR
ncbi:MAG: hypothetical protein IIT68_03795 [Treponema sp.]|nr:hypothetical protein [Treponema sp.]